MSSIASVEGDIVPIDHRIVYSHNRMVGSVCYLEMGFVVRGPSIGQYCQLFGGLGPPLQLIALDLGTWEVLLLS